MVVLLAVVGVALAMGAVWPDDGAKMEAERYCRMVWIHQHDARYGWPDYAHVYAAQCHADGTLNEEYVHGW